MELSEIYKPIRDDLAKVEEELRAQLASEDKFVSLIGKYTLANGGKRLRPALVLLSSKVGQADQEKAVSLASAVELVHTATLVHDDIIDKAILRRRRPTINVRWGNDISILFGDYLYSRAFGILSNLGIPELLHRLSRVLDTICEGEIQQIKKCFDLNLTESDYFFIIKKKTANFLSICCEAGAVLANADPVKIKRLGEYGLNFGMAFQITDDYLDLVGREEEVGKSLGSDIKEGKVTLPLIYLLRALSAKGKCEVNSFIREKKGIEKLRQMLIDYGSIGQALEKAKDYISCAKEKIKGFKPYSIRKSLTYLADYCVERVSL